VYLEGPLEEKNYGSLAIKITLFYDGDKSKGIKTMLQNIDDIRQGESDSEDSDEHHGSDEEDDGEDDDSDDSSGDSHLDHLPDLDQYKIPPKLREAQIKEDVMREELRHGVVAGTHTIKVQIHGVGACR
jgi:hypothetical protein